ncbi:hypothetical protein HYR54_16865 [Candidatus Acetothermia bacterium]|nr:hypothetical protein [Candidatus Acetothermia bacterium]
MPEKALKRRQFLKGAAGAAITASLLGKVHLGRAATAVGVFEDTSAIFAGAKKALREAADYAAKKFDVTLQTVTSAADAKGMAGVLSLSFQDAAVAKLASELKDVAIIDAVGTAPYSTRLNKSAPSYFRMPAHELMALQNFYKAAAGFNVKEREFLYVSKDRPGLNDDLTLLSKVISKFDIGPNKEHFTVKLNSIPADTTAATMPDQAAAIIAKKPNGIVMSLDPDLAAVLVKQVAAVADKDARPAVIVHEPYGLNIDYFLKNLSKEERTAQKWVFYNLQYIKPAADKEPATFKSVNADFKAKLGRDISALDFVAYTGVQAFAGTKKSTAADVLSVLNKGDTVVKSGKDMLIDLWGDVAFGEFDFQDVRQNVGATPFIARINDKGEFEIAPVGVSPLSKNVFIQIGNFICNNLICGSF